MIPPVMIISLVSSGEGLVPLDLDKFLLHVGSGVGNISEGDRFLSWEIEKVESDNSRMDWHPSPLKRSTT